MDLKSVLFDFDGTLIDSEQFHYNCWCAVLHDFSIHIQHDDYMREFAGVPDLLTSSMLIREYKMNISAEELAGLKYKLTLSHLKTDDIFLMPYAMEMIHFLKNMDLPLAIVTGSTRDDVNVIIERTNIAQYFDVIVTKDDVNESKPHPESYIKCLRQLGLQNNEAVVLEDTPIGVQAAKSAGLTCYGVQQSPEIASEMQSADTIFRDLNEAKHFLEETYK